MAFLTETPRAHRFPSPLDAVAGLARVVSNWLAVARERQALREMSWSRLDDLGLSDADAAREARKPFWIARRG